MVGRRAGSVRWAQQRDRLHHGQRGHHSTGDGDAHRYPRSGRLPGCHGIFRQGCGYPGLGRSGHLRVHGVGDHRQPVRVSGDHRQASGQPRHRRLPLHMEYQRVGPDGLRGHTPRYRPCGEHGCRDRARHLLCRPDSAFHRRPHYCVLRHQCRERDYVRRRRIRPPVQSGIAGLRLLNGQGLYGHRVFTILRRGGFDNHHDPA